MYGRICGFALSCLFVLVGSLADRIAAAPACYEVVDLGTLGGRYSAGYRLNNDRLVAGMSETAQRAPHAFVWRNGVMQDLGTLGGDESYAIDVNQAGQVVGFAETANGLTHAFFWDGDRMRDLGALGHTASFAYSINAKGQVVGEASNQFESYSSADVRQAFLWEDGRFTRLEAHGWPQGAALSINDAGLVVGMGLLSAEDCSGDRDCSHAMLWENGVSRDLGTLGGPEARGMGINEAGWVVGTSLDQEYRTRPFLWRDGQMADIGTLGATNGEATAINAAGQIVGILLSGDDGADRHRGFLWTAGVMLDLNDLLPLHTDWFILEAWDINDHGEIVAAARTAWGEQRAVLLVPTGEPCFSPPPNDTCENAITIQEGAVLLVNIGAATEDPFEALPCYFGNGADPRPTTPFADVWFRFVATRTADVSIRLDGPVGDWLLAVYEADVCPSDGRLLVCFGDFAEDGANQIGGPVVEGQTYYIRVAGKSGAQGEGLLSVFTDAPPANDECADAMPVADGLTTFHTMGATAPDPEAMGGRGGNTAVLGSDVWFCYTASCSGYVSVDLKGTTFEARPAVYDGCACVLLDEEPIAYDASGVSNDGAVRAPHVLFSAAQGQELLIRVGAVLEQGPGMLEIECLPPPANDACEHALPVTDGRTRFHNLGAATEDPYDTIPCYLDDLSPSPTTLQSDVWFSYTAPHTGIVSLGADTDFDFWLFAIYAGTACHPPATPLGCLRPSSGISGPVTAGQTYLIRIGTLDAASQGTGTLHIRCDAAPPNDRCPDALPIADGRFTFGNQYAGESAADGDIRCGDEPVGPIQADVWYCYTTPGEGQVMVDVGNSSFDAAVAVYAGCACPPDVASLVASTLCQGDVAAPLVFPASAGTRFLFRAGSPAGWPPQRGTGRLAVKCHARPDNDLCPDAMVIGDGLFALDTILATVDPSGSSVACPPDSDGGVGGIAEFQNDLWFCYTAPCDGLATVRAIGETFLPALAVYAGCACPAATEALACGELDWRDQEGPEAVHARFPTVQGDRYLLRVGGHGSAIEGEARGTGYLEIECHTPPPNDDCENALEVEDGVVPWSNFLATLDGSEEIPSCVDDQGIFPGDDIWYRYTPDCAGEVTISLCDTAFDTYVAVYEGSSCPPGAERLLACNDNSEACGKTFGQSHVTFHAEPGASYLIRIGGVDWSEYLTQGRGNMELHCNPAPPNDHCTDALAVGCGAYQFSTWSAATEGPPLDAACEQVASETPVGDIWYCYTAPGDGRVSIDLCGSSFDTVLAVYDGCDCPSPDTPTIACSDDAEYCGTGSYYSAQSYVTFTVSAGQRYLVRIGGAPGGWGGSRGTGTMAIVCQLLPTPSHTPAGTATPHPCRPFDANSDGVVDSLDLMHWLTAREAGDPAAASPEQWLRMAECWQRRVAASPTPTAMRFLLEKE